MRLKQGCEPWFNGEILESISNRDKAWVKFKKSKSDENYADFKRLRNKTQFAIKKAKTSFVKNQISENQSASKKVWKILKDLGMPTKSKGTSSNIRQKNNCDEICFDSDFVANKFHNFFLTLPVSL